MVIRTFFDRNNTVVYNSPINTGKNPITELVYGGYNRSSLNELNISGNTSDDKLFSRFIFHFDEKRLKELHNDGTFCDLNNLTHKIKLTNTGAFDTDLIGKTTCGGKCRANSFDLVLFPLDQEWDEGVGYDYGDCGFLSSDSVNVCNGNSSWCGPRTDQSWTGNSMYNGECEYVDVENSGDECPQINYTGQSYTGGTPPIIARQRFEDGNEDIEFDVTDFVNEMIELDIENYGFGIAYEPRFECLQTSRLQYVGFFTRHTQTFYEPFLESTYNKTIEDDRANFYLDKLNKIYLYVNVGGEPKSLDYLPDLTIKDAGDNVITTYSSDTISCTGETITGSVVSNVNCVTKGVYSADVYISSSDYPNDDCIDFTDTWSNICINGIKRPDIELDFIIKDSLDYYNIGDNDSLPKKYGLKIIGIKHGEKIKRGDIRRVNVSARIPYTVNQSDIIDGLEYRLYVKEGRNQYTVINFQEINKAHNSNYFYIDTKSLIPNTYYLDVKVKSHNEVTTLSEELKFDIVSQSELRVSQ